MVISSATKLDAASPSKLERIITARQMILNDVLKQQRESSIPEAGALSV